MECHMVLLFRSAVTEGAQCSYRPLEYSFYDPQGEIRSFRVRLCSGFITETQVSANGNLRTVHTNYRYFSPVCDYAGNVDLNNSY